LVDLGQRHAGDPGDAGAEAEGQRVDPGRAHAHGPRHGPVLGDGAHLQPERVRFSTSSSATKTSSAKTRIQSRL
jgi:hypothetical protein